MVYTNTEPTSVGTTHTASDTAKGTKNSQVEPVGYGLGVYGHPSTHKLEKEYSRGYGEPKTRHTEDNDA